MMHGTPQLHAARLSLAAVMLAAVHTLISTGCSRPTPPAAASPASAAAEVTVTLPQQVQVPEYLEQGELVKVSTVTGKYMSRA